MVKKREVRDRETVRKGRAEIHEKGDVRHEHSRRWAASSFDPPEPVPPQTAAAPLRRC